MAVLQLCHHAAHIFHAGRAQFRLDGFNRSCGFSFAHLLRQKHFDNRDFGRFGIRQLRAAAFGVQINRFAALFDHFLQHFRHQHIIIAGGLARARFDIAVFNSSLDEPDCCRFWLISALHGLYQRGL